MCQVCYCQTRALDNGTEKPWCPSIHMPRWASRITLEITDVRVERLQDISDAEAIREGVDDWGSIEEADSTAARLTEKGKGLPLLQFRILWDDLNAKRGYGWDANPWVWVIGFRRVEHAV